jgi:hypothetical protein
MKALNALTPSTEQASAWPRGLRIYFGLHCAWFALYALLGKGFAYAGYQPFYVGELLLVLAVFALIASRRLAMLALTPIGGAMVCFGAWQLICAAPYLSDFGVDTLRDSVVWGYAVFALVAGAIVLRVPACINLVVDRYRRFAGVYLFIGPVALLASLYLHDWLPAWPGTSVPIALLRRGDYAVQLAGISAFSLQALGGASWWTAAALVEATLGMSNRGGMVALLSACALILLLRPRLGRLALFLAVALIVVALMAAFDVHFYPPGANREVSLEVLTNSLQSVFGDSERSDLESTKGWRLSWWSRIWDYTFYGPYFWFGKGYGINLADSDGFQVGTREEPLRSPHNSHLTILARSGVPGFLLWLILQLTWAGSIIRSYLRSRRLRSSRWAGFFAWILAFWLAFTVEAAFDVVLEGPMSGIPFWTMFGIGWGADTLFQKQQLLRVLGGAKTTAIRSEAA